MSGLPAYMQNRQPGVRPSVGQSLVQGISSPQPPRVSIAGNRFSLIDSAGNVMPLNINFQDQATGQMRTMPATELDIIFVGTNDNVSKVYYEGAFDPNGDSNSPPTCWSDNGVAPSVQASQPQNTICATCRHAAWGSRVNAQTGNQSKACTDKKKAAVRLAYGGDATIYQFQVPPASLKALAAMVHALASQDFGGRSADVTDVIVRVGFESQGVLKFSAVGFYDDATYAQIEQLLQPEGQAKIDYITGRKDVPRSAAPAPVQQVTYQPPVEQPRAVQAHPARTAPFTPNQPQPQPDPYRAVAQQVQHLQAHPELVAPFTLNQPGPVHPALNQPQSQLYRAEAQPAPQAQQAPQTPAQPKTRRRGRPPLETSQQPQATQPAFQQPVPATAPAQPQFAAPSPPPTAAPAFLQSRPVQQALSNIPVPAAPPEQKFGMVSSPAAPDPALAAQLASVFNLPT